MKTIKLKSGFEMPVLGLGTWQMRGEDCKTSIVKALKLGYTHIDTAYVYDNQKEVGEGVKESGLERDKIFVTSKVWRDSLHYNDLISQAEEILSELGLEYVDLLLVHWPNKAIPIEETMKGLKELVDKGKVKSIGVSNFTKAHLQEALEVTDIPISVNQVEFNLYLNQSKLLEYCKEKGIVVTAYCPLSRGDVLDNKVVKEIAEKHGKTTAQVALKWLNQKGIIAIPKSKNEERIKENLDSLEFELDGEDMGKLERLDKGYRHCNPGFSEF